MYLLPLRHVHGKAQSGAPCVLGVLHARGAQDTHTQCAFLLTPLDCQGLLLLFLVSFVFAPPSFLRRMALLRSCSSLPVPFHPFHILLCFCLRWICFWFLPTETEQLTEHAFAVDGLAEAEAPGGMDFTGAVAGCGYFSQLVVWL